jgi:hypothetical protein
MAASPDNTAAGMRSSRIRRLLSFCKRSPRSWSMAARKTTAKTDRSESLDPHKSGPEYSHQNLSFSHRDGSSDSDIEHWGNYCSPGDPISPIVSSDRVQSGLLPDSPLHHLSSLVRPRRSQNLSTQSLHGAFQIHRNDLTEESVMNASRPSIYQKISGGSSEHDSEPALISPTVCLIGVQLSRR